MLTLGQLSVEQLQQRLFAGSLLIDIHPFVTRIHSSERSMVRDLALLYADFPVLSADTFADFHVSVSRERGLRRWVKPTLRFYFDGLPAFVPLRANHAMACHEWGLNWCVSAHSHQYLVIHAAVVERGGFAALMPAPPGSGKSTLCAALVQRGWRLLSDELALFNAATGLVLGMARPINLKNKSIDVIRAFEPGVVMTAPVADTTKGTVALLRPPASSVRRAREPATPRWVVLPRYSAGSPPTLKQKGRARTSMLVAEQSFNYDVLGRRGFDAVTALLDACEGFELEYSQLDDAVGIFERLAESRAP